MSLFKRKRLLVDANVQGALFLRIIVCWISSLVAIGCLGSWLESMQLANSRLFDHFGLQVGELGLVTLASLIILPMVLYDALVLSNRFAGPVMRLRRSMRALAAGERVEPLRFRNRDFWQEMAQEFNVLVQQHEELKNKLANEAALHEAKNKDSRELAAIAAN